MKKLFSKKSFSILAVVLAIGVLLGGSLLIAQTMFMQVPGGGLLFDQQNPVIRYSGRLNFQTLGGTLHFKAPITGTGTIDFSSATTGTCSTDASITVTGTASGDTVLVSPPAAVVLLGGSTFFGWVSGANMVYLRHCNVSGGTVDPASGVYRVDVFGH